MPRSGVRPTIATWIACAALLLLLLAGAGSFMANRLSSSPLRGLVTAVNYTWPTVDPATVTWPTYPSLDAELASSPFQIRSGVIAPQLTSSPFEMCGIFKQSTADPALILIVLVPCPDSTRVPASAGMVIQIGMLTRVPAGSLIPGAGTVTVRATLSPQQAAVVRLNGIPPALEQALVAEARSRSLALFSKGAANIVPAPVEINPTSYLQAPTPPLTAPSPSPP